MDEEDVDKAVKAIFPDTREKRHAKMVKPKRITSTKKKEAISGITPAIYVIEFRILQASVNTPIL